MFVLPWPSQHPIRESAHLYFRRTAFVPSHHESLDEVLVPFKFFDDFAGCHIPPINGAGAASGDQRLAIGGKENDEGLVVRLRHPAHLLARRYIPKNDCLVAKARGG